VPSWMDNGRGKWVLGENGAKEKMWPKGEDGFKDGSLGKKWSWGEDGPGNGSLEEMRLRR